MAKEWKVGSFDLNSGHGITRTTVATMRKADAAFKFGFEDARFTGSVKIPVVKCPD